MSTDSDYRLPTAVQPTHYDLAIKTDLASSPPTFSGEAIISLDVVEDASRIVFHIHPSTKITHLALAAGKESKSLPIGALAVDDDKERATVDISSAGGLKAGDEAVKLLVRWEGELGGNMSGYYKSNGDLDENGKRPIYALTQFEPTSARRAMPCWDEPLFKATFAISMIARESETVLSNMSSASSNAWAPEAVKIDAAFKDGYEVGSTLANAFTGKDKEEGSWTITKFNTTPRMSTYIVAWACGEFTHLESAHESKLTGKTVPLKIYATSDIKQAQMGLDVMKWSLPVYEELFEVAYPLPKLDTLVAHDFDMGAMENWGLITGRTTAYFCNERSSLAAKKRVGTVQCHEVAHMWFGNIVTMKWWDNLWLNEAFATLMGSLVLPERIWPEWKATGEFIDTHLVRALTLDAKRSSHPIQVECPDSSKINQIFDGISYSKGASVLRMLMSVVGEEKFFKGVSFYLKDHLYGNAEMDDLWAGISRSVGKDVGKMMTNWTRKIGYPVINVEELGDGKLKLTQNRFLSTGDVKPEEDETLWWVPLEIKSIADGKETVDHDAVLDGRSSTVTVSSDSFKLNAETIGVYRVAYSAERLAKLGKEAQAFSVADRVGIMADATALARAGYSETSGALTLALELAAKETEYLPLARVAALLNGVSTVWWENEAIREAINKVRVEVFRPVVDKLGYDHAEADSPDVKELRALAVATAAAAGDETVIAELKRRFDKYIDGDDSLLTPDLQRAIFKTAARHGGSAEYEKLLDVYNNPPNPSTKVDVMVALGATRETSLLDRTFNMLGDAQAIKDQDLYMFFAGLAGNRDARHRVADYLMDNWGPLNKRFHASFGLRNTIAGVFGALSSKKDLEKVKAFVAANDVTKYKLVVEQQVEEIQAASDWIERAGADVEKWLKEKKYL